jgi:hypothetical protein
VNTDRSEVREGGIPLEDTFHIEGKVFHGRRDRVAGVLLLNERPAAGAVWETDEGPYHVAYVTSVTHPQVSTFVAHMKPGRGPGVRPTSG